MIDIAFIDHYDSFSFNLIDWLEQARPRGLKVQRFLFDDPNLPEKLPRGVPLVLSPGPGHPEQKLPTRKIVEQHIGKVPILGVCLGHQILGGVAGLGIRKARTVFHGSVVQVNVVESSPFLNGVPKSFYAAVYNSLALENQPLREFWQVSGMCEKGDIQILEYLPDVGMPALGMQYHPESFMSENQGAILENWVGFIERIYKSLA